MKFELTDFHRNVSNEELVKDVLRVRTIYGKDTLTRDEYKAYGKYGTTTLRRHFGSWNKTLEVCGIKVVSEKRISTERLYKEIERLWIKLGRAPTSTDIRNGESEFSSNTFSRHFGSWRQALRSFVNYMNSGKNHNHADQDNSSRTSIASDRKEHKEESGHSIIQHKTKREPNSRLTYLVLRRDHFRCCCCGASPANDQSVQLVVDHINPWSKGGETVFENLQTLCSKCNNGKSDL
jgi:5-methylcytosine-specific restriction endonuclease McrA